MAKKQSGTVFLLCYRRWRTGEVHLQYWWCCWSWSCCSRHLYRNNCSQARTELMVGICLLLLSLLNYICTTFLIIYFFMQVHLRYPWWIWGTSGKSSSSGHKREWTEAKHPKQVHKNVLASLWLKCCWTDFCHWFHFCFLFYWGKKKRLEDILNGQIEAHPHYLGFILFETRRVEEQWSNYEADHKVVFHCFRYQEILHSIHLTRKGKLSLRSCDGYAELLKYLRSDIQEIASRLQKGGLGYLDDNFAIDDQVIIRTAARF